MTENWFGEAVARSYDDSSGDMFAPSVVDPAVSFLADLAGGGRALELGIGTGRIALPLASRGVGVHGIDLSPEMVARLKEKPGGEAIDVAIGDFATTRVAGTFTVAYLVFNTIGNLTTQDAQVACFENVARHLAPGGSFVIEILVPALRSLPPGERIQAFDLGPDHAGVDEYDTATQSLVSHHFSKVGGGWVRNRVPFRYVWPGELDLMARIAGLTLAGRFADWDRAPFTHESTKHVSVYARPR
jgi:SAM-dependent methyltransferase